MWDVITVNEQIRIRNMEINEYETDGLIQTLRESGIKPFISQPQNIPKQYRLGTHWVRQKLLTNWLS